MNSSSDPETWETPPWHADYGDAHAEVNHLREIAKAALCMPGGCHVKLETPEPGLMYVSIWAHDRCIAEVYSNEAIDSKPARRYGVFTYPGTKDGDEFYCDSASEVTTQLALHVLL